MIISAKHRYLFIELPLTGSTAVAKELVELYDGQNILRKHSTYDEFLRSPHCDGGKRCVIAGIRNPLDQAVSHYFKLKLDHNSKFSRQAQGRNDGSLHSHLFRRLRARQFNAVHNEDASFERFLVEFYPRPYSNWSILSHKQFDAVLRFENLSRDFSEALRRVGIAPQRDLPIRNKTGERGEWIDYYRSERIREHAKWVFAPFMAYWEYAFPSEWGEVRVSPIQRTYYNVLNAMRVLYWKSIRYRV